MELEEEYYDGDRDPLIPPDYFTENERRSGVWFLYLIGFFIVTSAASFVTHNFMVRGVVVGMERTINKRIKRVVEPFIVSLVKCWPKFVLGMISQFLLLNSAGTASAIGSIGFNLHLGVAFALFLMTASQEKYRVWKIFLNLFILLINCSFIYLIGICNFNSSPLRS